MRTTIDDIEMTRRMWHEAEKIFDFTSMLADEDGNLTDEQAKMLSKLFDHIIEVRCDLEGAWLEGSA